MAQSRELYELLKEVLDAVFESSKFSDLVTKFEAYYETHERHFYSEIAEFVIDHRDNEKIEYLTEAVEKLAEDANTETTKGQLLKLYDHIALEYLRFSAIDRQHTLEIKKLESDLNTENQKLTEMINKTKQLEQRGKRQNIDLVALLGMFTTIVFALFGGVSMIHEIVVLLAVNQVPLHKALLVIATIGIFLFNLIFTMFYFISKIMGIHIGINSECELNGFMSTLKRCWKRHPIFFWGNVFFVVAMAILIGAMLYGECLALSVMNMNM